MQATQCQVTDCQVSLLLVSPVLPLSFSSLGLSTHTVCFSHERLRSHALVATTENTPSLCSGLCAKMLSQHQMNTSDEQVWSSARPVSSTEDGVEAFPPSKKPVKALARARLVLQVLHLSTRVLEDMEAQVISKVAFATKKMNSSPNQQEAKREGWQVPLEAHVLPFRDCR